MSISNGDPTQAINSIRFLAIDAVEKANSGHPGLPMGCAPMSFILFDEFMKFNPKNPYWVNRDRFVLSAGHGCMLQYALLHLFGYDSVPVSAMQSSQWSFIPSIRNPDCCSLYLGSGSLMRSSSFASGMLRHLGTQKTSLLLALKSLLVGFAKC